MCVWPLAQRAATQAVTWSTQAIVTLPIRAQPRGGGATLHTRHTPGGKTHNTRLWSCQQRAEKQGEINKKKGRRRNEGRDLVDRQVDPPLALPGSLWYGVKGRVQAVGVVADVAVVAEQQSARVAGFTAGLAHCALKTAPPLGQDDPSNLWQGGVECYWSHTY